MTNERIPMKLINYTCMSIFRRTLACTHRLALSSSLSLSHIHTHSHHNITSNEYASTAIETYWLWIMCKRVLSQCQFGECTLHLLLLSHTYSSVEMNGVKYAKKTRKRNASSLQSDAWGREDDGCQLGLFSRSLRVQWNTRIMSFFQWIYSEASIRRRENIMKL